MSCVRMLFLVGLLASIGPAFAGGALHGGIGFHGGGFHGGVGFHGGFTGGHIGFGPGFGPPGHGGFLGFHGFFGGLHPGLVNPIFVGLGPGRFGKGRYGYGDRYSGYGYGYPGNYGSSYNRYGWRKWWTYTDFSQINYPGVYPVTVDQPDSRSQY